ncbi:hypothetical protein JW899_04480 [Candidatus Uhrbacteria bacterium]|nr:hypothetical protein [Candidatus Uhrbacteria bacterium]
MKKTTTEYCTLCNIAVPMGNSGGCVRHGQKIAHRRCILGNRDRTTAFLRLLGEMGNFAENLDGGKGSCLILFHPKFFRRTRIDRDQAIELAQAAFRRIEAAIDRVGTDSVPKEELATVRGFRIGLSNMLLCDF